jgi:hypothetical protein
MSDDLVHLVLIFRNDRSIGNEIALHRQFRQYHVPDTLGRTTACIFLLLH